MSYKKYFEMKCTDDLSLEYESSTFMVIQENHFMYDF